MHSPQPRRTVSDEWMNACVDMPCLAPPPGLLSLSSGGGDGGVEHHRKEAGGLKAPRGEWQWLSDISEGRHCLEMMEL